VGWQFELKGVIAVDATEQDADEIQLAAIEAGADDVDESGDGSTIDVITDPGATEQMRQVLTEAGFTVESADVSKVPQNTVDLDEKAALATLNILEKLDDLDDVSKVYSNAEFPDSVLEAAVG
jgi:transcriptional/translational regulatory protein YebC/TACO1